ncbi:MAG: hypothetical protein ACT4PZ_23920 [Panacagrimonas sp.]|nr:A377 [uncultured bacterium]
MSTIRSFRSFAVRSAAVVALAVSALTPALAADPTCEPKSRSISTLPAPGSIEAWKMAKFPWLYLPRSPITPVTTHFPEPGSAEALKMAKTPYLYYPRVPASAEGSGKKWPEPGSAEAVRFYKTPYLAAPRSTVPCN